MSGNLHSLPLLHTGNIGFSFVSGNGPGGQSVLGYDSSAASILQISGSGHVSRLRISIAGSVSTLGLGCVSTLVLGHSDDSGGLSGQMLGGRHVVLAGGGLVGGGLHLGLSVSWVCVGIHMVYNFPWFFGTF